MRVFIVCATVLAGLAGCLEEADDPGAVDLVPAPAFSLTDRIHVDDYPLAGFSAGESFITVSPDGDTILTCTHGSFIEDSPSYVSEDGGQTWRRVEFPPGVLVGGDCETDIMDDGTWVFLTSTIEQNTIITTSDRGETFTWSNLATWPTPTMADRPWVESAGDRLLATFMPLSPTAGWIGFSMSDDKAATWTFTEHITEWDGTHVGVIHGKIQVHEDQQRILVPTIKYDQPSDVGVGQTPVSGKLGYAYSDDVGETWTEFSITDTMALVKQPPTMALAGDRLWFVHMVPDGPAWDLVLWRSEDVGATWEEPVILLDDLSNPDINWIDGAADGTATYLMQAEGSDFGFPDGDRYASIRLDMDAPGLIAYTHDLGPGSNEFITVDHDAQGRAHFSFGAQSVLWFMEEQWVD